MIINNNPEPKSAFLSVEKDMSIVTNYICRNENLKKYLYYTTKDCLNQPNLTEEQTIGLFGKNIKLVPKLYVDKEVLNYIIIKFDDFVQSGNPQYRNNILEFDIICHFDQWQLDSFKLRPYRIAAELDSMLDQQRLTGIGRLEFFGASQIMLSDEFAGLCLMYMVYHGEDDKTVALTQKDAQQIAENWENFLNND